MKKIILYFAVVLAPIIHEAQTQNLYYKTLTDSIINTFSVDTNHLSIKRTDPMIKYKNYFNYVLCFYKNLEYKKIRIRSQKHIILLM
ncbi:MAG: hypothetical protein IPG08_13835 [Sphingobacteriaceae bacterium]|nr:hypothetical protein [Sphingobacteriaceae bacterium]